MLDLEQPATQDSAPVVDTGTPEANEDAIQEPQLDENGQPIEVAPVDDEEDDELDGVKLRGKKEALEKLKAERLMQADYTRKTQAIAEEKREAEAVKAQYQQAVQVQHHLAAEIGELQVIDRALSQYANVNWQAWADQDAAAASKAHMAFTQLQAQRGQLVNSVTTKNQQLQAFNESESSKRANAAEAVVARELKDWSPEKYRVLQDYAKAEGVDPEGLRQMLINVPLSAKIIEKARKFDALQKQRLAKPPAAPAPPASRVGGGSAANTTKLSEVSDEEYIRRRREYIKNHR